MVEACLFSHHAFNLSKTTGEPKLLLILNWIPWKFILVCYYTSNVYNQEPHTRFLSLTSKPIFHYVLWAQHDSLLMQYQSLTWYKSAVSISESYLLIFQIVSFILLCFVFWDILFRVPVFSQRVIARIFLYMPYSFLHSYLYPYNSKRMLSKFTKNFPKSNFLLSQQHFVFFFLWLLWHRIVLFSFHSSLATASQSFGVGVPALHFCPCPTVCSVCSYLLDPVLQGHAGPGPQVWTQIMFKLLKCKIFKTKLNFPVAVSLGSHFC